MECCPRKPPYAGAICSDSLSPCRQGHLWLWAQQLVQTGHHTLSCISPETNSPVTYPAAPVQSQWQESQHWSQEYRWIKLLHTYKSEIRIILHSMCSCEQESEEREEHPLWESLLPLGEASKSFQRGFNCKSCVLISIISEAIRGCQLISACWAFFWGQVNTGKLWQAALLGVI